MPTRAIHRKHFLLQCLKKEIATPNELDLIPLGKVIIFRDKQTNRQNLPIKYKYISGARHVENLLPNQCSGRIVFRINQSHCLTWRQTF